MFIAEIGINHNGDINLAKCLIYMAYVAGVDVVKFQKRTPELCVPKDQWDIVRDTPFGQMRYIDYKHRIEFGKKEYDEIDAYCRSLGIKWTASVWDLEALEFMLQYEVPFIKVPSAMITHAPLLTELVAHGMPVVMSTGMSTQAEIDFAVEILAHTPWLGILHCNSSYPSRLEELDLRMIETLKLRYPDHHIGYSGHEEGYMPTIVAKVLGARILERHITIDKDMKGSDHKASLDPSQLHSLMQELRSLDVVMGSDFKKVYDTEKAMRAKLRGD